MTTVLTSLSYKVIGAPLSVRIMRATQMFFFGGVDAPRPVALMKGWWL